MNKKFTIAALALFTLASCTDNEFVGETNTATNTAETQPILFGFNVQNSTRAGDEFIGATAAEMLGGMFVVEGTKGTEQTNSPSTTVVFDNYLVGYEYNHAGKTESDTHNWEYVGKQAGITDRMTAATWTALHGTGTAQAQTIKYWDFSAAQYDFIAWSTGKREAVTDNAVSGSKIKVTRINTGSDLASNGFTMTALSAADLMECYYTDITTVEKGTNGANYGKPVTLTFKNMAAKVRVALYETVPGYSVKDVYFYISDANPTAPEDLGTPSTQATSGSDDAKAAAKSATLFTMGDNKLPQSGSVLVYYPYIGTQYKTTTPTDAYNKASVTVTPDDGTAVTKQAFGALTDQYSAAESHEAAGNIYLGRTLPNATFAGSKAKDYYTAVIPNTNGMPLTLRLDYTLVATDGSGEEIKVYGAKAVVPATYTVWLPNYAYTYVFKISDNSNGWTSQTYTDPKGLFPITFDAMVASFTDANAEQTTVTTVATPSITTYQQGHEVKTGNDEYSKSQTAGASSAIKDVYVQVMNNSGATPTLVNDLNGEAGKKSLLFAVTTTGAPISEATVMDALQNRTNSYNDASPVGRNGITLTTNGNIDNTVTQIINGVDDQPITKIAGNNIAAGQVAKIAINSLIAGNTYAYVYASKVPTKEEKIYHVASVSNDTEAKKYYEVSLTGSEALITSTADAADKVAKAGYVYFVKNVDKTGAFVSYTFKQTKVGDDVVGLVGVEILTNKATSYTEGHFYFDVYNQNDGEYAVKVIKVVD